METNFLVRFSSAILHTTTIAICKCNLLRWRPGWCRCRRDRRASTSGRRPTWRTRPLDDTSADFRRLLNKKNLKFNNKDMFILEPNQKYFFGRVTTYCTTTMHSNWWKLMRRLVASIHNAIFPSGVITPIMDLFMRFAAGKISTQIYWLHIS